MNRLRLEHDPERARPTKSRRRAQDHALELLARVQRSQVEGRRRERRTVGREDRDIQRRRRRGNADDGRPDGLVVAAAEDRRGNIMNCRVAERAFRLGLLL